MSQEEQQVLLELWREFLSGRRPTGALMREFYFDVVSDLDFHRYGMSAEVFDLLVNGPFRLEDSSLWAPTLRAAMEHRAA